MSSNYTSFAFDRNDPRQVKFSPNAQRAEQPSKGYISESCGCTSMLGSEDAEHGGLGCRMHNADICVIAGNAKTALYARLWNVRCREDISEADPSTWLPLNIAGYKYITAYIRKMDDHDEFFVLHGYPIAPLNGGKVVFLFHEGVLDCVGGIYEGEVEIEFKTGRIVTAIEWFRLRIEEDFSGHGHRNTHPDCDDPVDHLPEIPGIQLHPELPLEQLPEFLVPEIPTQLPANIDPEMQAVMRRNSIRRMALEAHK